MPEREENRIHTAIIVYMLALTIQDSNYIDGVTKHYHDQCAAFMNVVDHLHTQIASGQLKIVKLHNYTPKAVIEPPVWYQICSYSEKRGGYKVVEKCKFFSSHFIGRYSYGGYSIILNPRFGNIFCHIVDYASNIYIPHGEAPTSLNAGGNAYWLIAILWKAMLNKALTTGQIPKEYHTITKNQKTYRGHLNIAKHIHANLCDKSHFYCTYKKLSMDNTINRTIRAIYKILKSKRLASLIAEFEAYDKYLCSMGVDSAAPDIHEIDNIRYTRLNAPYKPVMELCRTILSNHIAESSKDNSKYNGVSYFIDIADLWELYLLKLLQNNLPDEYYVYSPNSGFGDSLLDGGMREIRPDIIIEKDNRVIMIIDAKYKNYSKLGYTSADGVKREDLYQMTTYLHHYGNDETGIAGIFTAPVACSDNDIHSYSQKKNHRIGLVNLNIVAADDNIELLHENENAYIDKIKRILKSLC